MSTVVRDVFVGWSDVAKAHELAQAAGWQDGESLLDCIDEADCRKSRRFQTIKAARSWAVRNRSLDLWQSPEIVVYEYPNARQLSWQGERVKHERYQGSGDGWEVLQ